MKTFYTFLFLMILTFVSCNTIKPTAMTIQDLTGSYTVKTINNKEVKTVVPKFSFTGEDRSINGRTGCNSFFGEIELDGNAMQINQMGVSEMYCPDEGVMEMERDFLEALQNTRSFDLRDNTLIFYSDSGRKILEATRGITQ